MEALGTHQVDRGIATMAVAASSLADVSLLGLDQRAVGGSLVALVRLESQLAELKHRVLAHAATVHVQETTGATTAATWLAAATRVTVRAARRSAHLASGLEDYAVLRAGMAAGDVNVEQAEVIARALDALPVEVEAWVRVEAEQALVDAACEHDAAALRVLGDRILHLVAPEVGEAHEAQQLAEAERVTCLSMTPDGTGKVHGRFTVPDLHAGMLRKLLTALVVHDRPTLAPTAHHEVSARADQEAGHSTGVGAAPVPGPQRRATSTEQGRALCELLERLDGRDVPDLSTGAGPTVVVTMTLESLRGGLAAATLDTGDRVSAHTARRLACEAGIIPVVLNGKRKVLDVGRRHRLFTRAQRIALVVRDGGCTADRCRTAARFCHAHHDHPWSHGGRSGARERTVRATRACRKACPPPPGRSRYVLVRVEMSGSAA